MWKHARPIYRRGRCHGPFRPFSSRVLIGRFSNVKVADVLAILLDRCIPAAVVCGPTGPHRLHLRAHLTRCVFRSNGVTEAFIHETTELISKRSETPEIHTESRKGQSGKTGVCCQNAQLPPFSALCEHVGFSAFCFFPSVCSSSCSPSAVVVVPSKTSGRRVPP